MMLLVVVFQMHDWRRATSVDTTGEDFTPLRPIHGKRKLGVSDQRS